MQVELIRHGMTAWSAAGRYQGISDLPLSPEGRAALQKASESPDRVYVTRLARTGQTASILFPGAEQIIVPGLEEMNFGSFEGRTWKEMENDRDYRAWVSGGCLGRCPKGEDRTEYEERVCSAFLGLLEKEKSHGSGRLVIVAHGGTQMALLGRFGRPAREYWQWQRPCGCGYLLEVVSGNAGAGEICNAGAGEIREGMETVLKVRRETSYTLLPEDRQSGRDR